MPRAHRHPVAGLHSGHQGPGEGVFGRVSGIGLGEGVAGMTESSLKEGLRCTEASGDWLDFQAVVKPEAQCYSLLTLQKAQAL